MVEPAQIVGFALAFERKLSLVEERRVRLGSFVEWAVAALAVVALVWVISVPVARLTGPRVEASLVETREGQPPGVASGATSVPVMLLQDGRAIRLGDLESRLRQILPDRLADGRAHLSSGQFGDRQTRTYRVDGVLVQIVLERTERGGPSRVTGIFVD
jgi:hypothetical protein